MHLYEWSENNILKNTQVNYELANIRLLILLVFIGHLATSTLFLLPSGCDVSFVSCCYHYCDQLAYHTYVL